MSEHSTPEERTEMPTAKRLSRLKEEGQLHMSGDVAQTASLIAGFILLLFIWEELLSDFKLVLRLCFTAIENSEPLTVRSLYDGFIALLLMMGPDLAYLFLGTALVAMLAIFLQTNFNVKKKWIDIKLEKLNPIGGIGRIFSIQGVVNTLKALAKLALILPISYFVLKDYAPEMVSLMHLSIEEIFAFTGMAINDLFWRIIIVLICLAIIDWFWTRYQWYRQNKMTKEEVKDERKAVEGDEATKRKIQAKGLTRIMERIKMSVPQADVVITNPTHFAVALKYDREKMDAPRVVAKGRGFLALRIRKLARAANVPVLERKLLARALYSSTEVGAEIPRDLFKAVAEVLAYVYRLKNPHGYRAQAAT